MNQIFSAVSISYYTNVEFLVKDDNVRIRISNYRPYTYTVGNKIDQSHAYYFLFSVYLKN